MNTLKIRDVGGNIRVYLEVLNQEQAAEEAYFKASERENISADLYKSLIPKASSISIFDDMVRTFDLTFEGSLLELGGGYGYLSTYIKKTYPGIRVVYSDVSQEAVMKCSQYEEFFDVKLDEKWITSAEDTPFESEAFDTVMFFSSFHHTQQPAVAIREAARILKPGGKLFLLMEPSCPFYLKPLYDRHVRRAEVKENYYSISEYKRMFHLAGLTFQHYNYRNYIHRHSKRATLYYVMLSSLPSFVANYVPCTQVIIGKKAMR